MGKLLSAVALAAILTTGILIGRPALPVRAQTAPPTTCNGGVAAVTPMAGQYTGPWQSHGEYHFQAFGHDILLTVDITGTLNATVDGSGRVTGTIQGTVDAPVTHDGVKDVSSGTGTISGPIQGQFSPGSSLLELPAASILMHWGTFVGGGYTADRTIAMPVYQLNVAADSCIDAAGTLAEQGFPVQDIVDDANGGLVELPGVGSATGTWALTSDGAATYHQLSAQMDTVLGQAGALLSGPALDAATLNQQVVQPLQQLVASIRAHPDVARCLLDRLGGWEAQYLPALLARVQAGTAADLPAIRGQGDLLRLAGGLDQVCAYSTSTETGALLNAAGGLLDAAIAARDWANAALDVREMLLLGGTSGRATVQQRLDLDLHSAVSGAARADLVTLARAAEIFGDDADAQSAYTIYIGKTARLVSTRVTHKKHPKKHKPKPKATPRPPSTPKPKPTPRPTATPRPAPPPPTLMQVLRGALPTITPAFDTTGRTVTWPAVPSAVRYVVSAAAADHSVLWTWSGAATSIIAGDTALDGVSSSPPWPISDQPAEWSIIALDGQGRIVGAAYRAAP